MTKDEEIKKLKELVEAQKELLERYSDFMSAMPFTISDSIEDFTYWQDKVAELSEE